MPFDSLDNDEQDTGVLTYDGLFGSDGFTFDLHGGDDDGHSHGSLPSFSGVLNGGGISVTGGINAITADLLSQAVGTLSDGVQNALDFTLNIVDLTGEATQDVLDLFDTIASQALNTWGHFIDAAEGASLEVTVNVGGTNAVASAGPGTFAISDFFDLNGNGELDNGDFLLIEAGSLFELRTGIDVNGAGTDIVINVNPDLINSGAFFFDPELDDAVPPGQFDFFSVLLHEIGHGLGFLGIRDTDAPFDLPLFDLANIGLQGIVTIGTPFDLLIGLNSLGNPAFFGSQSVATYGDGVPLEFQTGSPGSDLSHFLGTAGGPVPVDTALTLLNPFVIPGDRVDIGQLELALLADIGLPIINFDDAPFINTFDPLPPEVVPTAFFGGVGSVQDGVLTFSINLTAQPPFLFIASSVGLGIGLTGGEVTTRVLYEGDETEAVFGVTLDDVFGVDTTTFVGELAGSLDIRLFNPAQANLDDGAREENTSVPLAFFGGDDGNDRLNGGNGIDLIFGRGGNDRLNGGDGDDFIDGGAGNDRINGQGGDDMLSGGGGNDRVIDRDGNNEVDAGAGNDRVNTGDGDDLIFGGDGNDRINAGDGDNGVDAGAGNDRVTSGDGSDVILSGDGDDRVHSGAGSDLVLGGGGNDRLFGQDGDDVISGGAGNDRIFGGEGADIFVFGPGSEHDDVRDFDTEQGDQVDLTGFGESFDSFDEILAAASQNGQHTVFNFGDGDILTLRSTQLSSLTEDDFVGLVIGV